MEMARRVPRGSWILSSESTSRKTSELKCFFLIEIRLLAWYGWSVHAIFFSAKPRPFLLVLLHQWQVFALIMWTMAFSSNFPNWNNIKFVEKLFENIREKWAERSTMCMKAAYTIPFVSRVFWRREEREKGKAIVGHCSSWQFTWQTYSGTTMLLYCRVS